MAEIDERIREHLAAQNAAKAEAANPTVPDDVAALDADDQPITLSE